jgi:hypothetical protein
VAHSFEDTLTALDVSDAQLQAIRRAARERTLDEHTSYHRALSLVRYLDELDAPEQMYSAQLLERSFQAARP